MSRIGSMKAMDKILKQTQSNSEKDKQSQKQRVGINPNLGNAGVMWESGKRVSWFLFFQRPNGWKYMPLKMAWKTCSNENEHFKLSLWKDRHT